MALDAYALRWPCVTGQRLKKHTIPGKVYLRSNLSRKRLKKHTNSDSICQSLLKA